MKVTTDACLFGAWIANEISNAKSESRNVLDIGAGTGLLSLMVAQKKDVFIDAVEIDAEATEQAKENIDASPWKNKIEVLNENILSFFPDKKYDVIISNPPFYENELKSNQQSKNIAHHSHELKLIELLKVIKNHLNEDGTFFLLLPFKREKEIEKLLADEKFFVQEKIIVKQSVHHQPFRLMIKASVQKPVQTSASELSIWNEHQQYTKEFIELLKDYYLYL